MAGAVDRSVAELAFNLRPGHVPLAFKVVPYRDSKVRGIGVPATQSAARPLNAHLVSLPSHVCVVPAVMASIDRSIHQSGPSMTALWP